MAVEDGAPGTAAGELVAFWLRRTGTCDECGAEVSKGSLGPLEDKPLLCLSCADLDHLEFLPRGNAALTRRACKYGLIHG